MRQPATERGFLVQVFVRATVLFILLNLGFALTDPLPALGRLSAYNRILPGRQRLPFGDNPTQAYNLSLNNLNAMFASHCIAGAPERQSESRVVLIGDSSVWGFLLENRDTLSSNLNALNLTNDKNERLKFYNLGYPTISLTKDLLLIDRALDYDPDLIVWLTTLEAFPYEKQFFSPLVQNNAEEATTLLQQHSLKPHLAEARMTRPNLLEETIVGQRRALADLLRLQLYGVMWAATGIDQVIADNFTPRAEDLEAVETYYGLLPGDLSSQSIAFDVLAAGIQHADGVPVLVVNEPMFLSEGENSDIRYNFFYPQWAYDQYRLLLEAQSEINQWDYVDAWLAVDNTEYSNSAIHLTPRGSQQLAAFLAGPILEITNQP